MISAKEEHKCRDLLQYLTEIPFVCIKSLRSSRSAHKNGSKNIFFHFIEVTSLLISGYFKDKLR